MRTRVEILREARQHIKNGWMQHDFDDGKRCCAMGAIVRATGGPHAEAYSEYSMAAHLERYLSTFIGAEDGYNILTFNDRPGRTKKEVLALFDRAIAGCRA